jgi:hypothetical protein
VALAGAQAGPLPETAPKVEVIIVDNGRDNMKAVENPELLARLLPAQGGDNEQRGGSGDGEHGAGNGE